jgi:YHS domain-containing protein
MILLLVVVGGLWLRGKVVSEARSRLTEVGPKEPGPGDDDEFQRRPWSVRARSKGAWADAAAYAISDLKMLRRELLIGYGVAGFLAVVVPTDAWNAVFLHGHGDRTMFENALVGPAIAVVSFVCSIGNVPLAAALWKGGISFGGVVSFIFADLITFPLLMVYRRYYGTRLMLKMAAIFWLVMSAAGLVTEVIFRAAGEVPAVHLSHIVPSRISWNCTTILDVCALALFGVYYWAYRSRGRLGGGGGYAIDPVCAMQVQTWNAPASCHHNGKRFYFCCDGCRTRFEAEPEKFHMTAPTNPADTIAGI